MAIHDVANVSAPPPEPMPWLVRRCALGHGPRRGSGRTPEVPLDDGIQRRSEALTIGAYHVRPLREVIALHVGPQLRVVLEVDPRCTARCQQGVPGGRAREHAILVGEVLPRARHPYEQYLHAARTQL